MKQQTIEVTIANIKSAIRKWRYAPCSDEIRKQQALDEIRKEAEIQPRALASVLFGMRGREDAISPLLGKIQQNLPYMPGSGYRTRKHPNPDGFRPDDMDSHSLDGFWEPLPALNVKVFHDFHGVDFDELREELGLDDKLAPARPGEAPLVFSQQWIEERFDLNDNGPRSQEFYDAPYTFAVESGWVFAQERAADLFAETPYTVKVRAAGRSGGWAVLEGLPSMRDMRWIQEKFEELDRVEEEIRSYADVEEDDEIRDTIEALQEKCEEIEDAIGIDREEWEKTLGALAEWCAESRDMIGNFSWNVAWHCGADVFECEAEQWQKDQETAEEKKEKMGALRDATQGLRDALSSYTHSDLPIQEMIDAVCAVHPELKTGTKNED